MAGTGFTQVAPVQARSGAGSAASTVNNNKGFTRVTFQVLTDANWATYTDGRQIVFATDCSLDGGTTFPFGEGGATIVGGGSGKGGTNPQWGDWIPNAINFVKAT